MGEFFCGRGFSHRLKGMAPGTGDGMLIVVRDGYLKRGFGYNGGFWWGALARVGACLLFF